MRPWPRSWAFPRPTTPTSFLVRGLGRGSSATRAEVALRKVLADGSPVTEPGYPGGCTASWFGVPDADGQVSGVGLVLSEVGGPAAAEEIRRSEERYRSLVQGGAQVVWVAGPDGAMAEDSPEWRWITGQSAEDFIGYGLARHASSGGPGTRRARLA